MLKWWVLTATVLAACAAGTAGAAEPAVPERPIDPFDYSYCGGKPVYPVIGINFATACGPRNQIGLGRRGHFMWLIPSSVPGGKPSYGKRLLPEETLKRITVLAEVVQLADAPPLAVGEVMYDLGIDFQGRPYKRVHAPKNDAYSPANALFAALLEQLALTPQLPECAGPVRDFTPTQLPADRTSVSVAAGEIIHEQN